MQQPVSQPKSQQSQPSLEPEQAPEVAHTPPAPKPDLVPQSEMARMDQTMLDETQVRALKLLGEGTKDTRQLTDTLDLSREHTARMMKELFELGLVRRNVATKPFVYQITDEGRNRLESGG